jgi:hypothetical protein
VEGGDDVVEDLAEMQAKVFEDLAGCGVAGGLGGDLGNFHVRAGEGGVVGLEASGGDEVFDSATGVGIVPDFAAWRDTFPLRDIAAVDGESGADACTEGETGGAVRAFHRALANLAEQVSRGIVEKTELVGLPPESDGESFAEVLLVQVLELVLHEADAGREIEGAGNGEGRAGDVLLRTGGFRAQAVKKIDKGGKGTDVVERTAGEADQLELGQAAKARADVASAHVEGQNMLT